MSVICSFPHPEAGSVALGCHQNYTREGTKGQSQIWSSPSQASGDSRHPQTALEVTLPSFHFCCRLLSCCCNTIPDKSNLKKGEFILAHRSRVQSLVLWQSCKQERGTTSHTPPTGRKQKCTLSLGLLHFHFVQDPGPHLGEIFSPQLTQSRNLLIHGNAQRAVS